MNMRSEKHNEAVPDIDLRIRQAVLATSALAKCREIVFSEDRKTDVACRSYLLNKINEKSLKRKVKLELGDAFLRGAFRASLRVSFRPLGRLLLIVSENDVLGTAQAFLGAYITGNRVLVKARSSLEILRFLKNALALDDDAVQIADWQGGSQDDAALLQDVDGIVLAGGADLIMHFRRVAPPHIRLIEFGPKISAAAVGGVALDDVDHIASLLVDEVGLFMQQVCSSPRFIMVEQKEVARRLFDALKTKLTELPLLAEDTRLAQAGKYAELQLMKRVGQVHGACLQDVAFEPANGWGMTLSQGLDASLWFEKGFQLVQGDLKAVVAQASRQWKGALQTLGMVGCDDLPLQGFTRFCPLGTMHSRPLSVPHDGFFELGAFVSFISKELDR